MLASIITNLQSAMNGPWALVAALAWGMCSIALSPCALVLVPMVMGFVSSQDRTSWRRTLALSAAFSCGVFVNLLVVSLPFVLGGAVLKPLLSVMHWVSFVLLLIFGLALLEVFDLPFVSSGALKARGTGLKGALLMGLLSGLVTGPCSLAFVAPVIALAANVAATNLAKACALVLAFALGYALLLCLAGLFSDRLEKALARGQGKATFWLRQICGWLVILASAFFLYTA